MDGSQKYSNQSFSRPRSILERNNELLVDQRTIGPVSVSFYWFTPSQLQAKPASSALVAPLAQLLTPILNDVPYESGAYG